MHLNAKPRCVCRFAAIAAVLLNPMLLSSLTTVGRGVLLRREVGVNAFAATTTKVTVSTSSRTGRSRERITRKEPMRLSMAIADPVQRTLQSRRHPKLLEPLVVCGPSGVGKGTIIASLMQQFASRSDGTNDDEGNPEPPFGFCVSHTTRQARPGEVDGVHYYFTSIEDIQRDIVAGKFVEHAVVHGNYYGTSKLAIELLQQREQITILDIDMQGVKSVKDSGIPAKYVFIAPPSLEELERRLRGRGTETEEAIQRRIGNAAKEISYGQQAGNFDHIFVNQQINQTVEEMTKVLKSWYPQLNVNWP